tara:strand:- start:2004 stop:3161 length:1158 start_codon:yes stop_codon:yes gene_type:complete
MFNFFNNKREDMKLLFSSVKKFCDKNIEPNYSAWENEGIFPKSFWQKLGQSGFLCIDIPEKYGGSGADSELAMSVPSIISYENFGSISVSMSVHSDIVAHYILNLGTEDQKQAYLPKMASGECIGAIAMTEPAAGSDLQGIKTHAKFDGNNWILNGSKTFITNGQHADIIIVAAKTNLQTKGSAGISLFLVNANSEGFSKGRNLEKLGLHSSDTSELFFNELTLPKDSILGGENKGFIALMKELPRERLVLAINAVAAVRGMLDITSNYVKEREAFGKPIAKFQNLRFKFAEMETKYRLNSSFIKECIDLFQNNNLDTSSASMAKLASTETQCEVADTCLQMFGGYGYMKEYPISRAFADARIQKIYGGTSEIMLELISRDSLTI